MASNPLLQLTRRLDENHDMTFGQGLNNFTQGSESVALCLETRIETILGEWFLDLTFGVPYLVNPTGIQPITQRPTTPDYIAATLKAIILATDGVATLNSFSADIDHRSRVSNVTANITTIYGDTLNIQVTP